VSRILARNELVYDLDETGRVVRLVAPLLSEALSDQVFTPDVPKLDELLRAARVKFLDPDPTERREALEKLWDAFERIKTLAPGKDKGASTDALISKTAAEPTFKALLDEESKTLAKTGNTFHIRHSETSQVDLQSDNHVDYLFHRLFALVWLFLRAR
jgi:hypothetical protein